MIKTFSNLFFRNIFIAAIIVNVIAAVFSVGYYYADEHYQIVEFAGYKLGTHAPNELAWEFSYRLRSAFQPALCYCILKSSTFINLHNPFMQMLLLRLSSALGALIATTFFVNTFLPEFKTEASKKIFITLSLLLWFIPFLNVRFSSETWAGMFFILSICILKGNESLRLRSNKIIATFIIACAVLLRYQMLLPLICAAVWFLFLDKNRLAFALIFCGCLLSFIIGAFVDRWFYGEWTWPLSNYARMVITGSGPDFGSEPWYYYFKMIGTKSALPIGVLLITSFIFFWLTNSRNLITYITLPFFVLHVFLPHKELRFLFPLVMFCPFVISILIEKIQNALRQSNFKLKTIFNTVLVLIAILNFGILAISVLLPASPGIKIAEAIRCNYSDAAITLLHTPYTNPYSPFESVAVKFYESKKVKQIKVYSSAALPDSVLNDEATVLFCLRNDDYDFNKQYLSSKQFHLVTYAIPPIIIKLNNDIWFTATDNFVLLERK